MADEQASMISVIISEDESDVCIRIHNHRFCLNRAQANLLKAKLDKALADLALGDPLPN